MADEMIGHAIHATYPTYLTHGRRIRFHALYRRPAPAQAAQQPIHARVPSSTGRVILKLTPLASPPKPGFAVRNKSTASM
jgi:hypothetical protein